MSVQKKQKREPTDLERLARIERLVEEAAACQLTLDENRAYDDASVCALLGGVSRTTLWRLRRQGFLTPIALVPDDGKVSAGTYRTTGRAIKKFLEERERAENVTEFTSTGRRRKG